MGRIVVTEFVSLDGVVEDPGGAEDFEHGGWASPSTAATRATSSSSTRRARPTALLLGRVTYEGFAEAWPTRDGEFADLFNSMPKYVVSSTLTGPASGRTPPCSRATSPRRSRRCKSALDGDLVVHGSAQLARTLLEHDLVDELRLMVFPVVLGSGKRLFGETATRRACA